MLELQQGIFNAMKADSELLDLLKFGSAVTESEISKRLLPTPPLGLIDELFAFIVFRQPDSYKSRRNPLFENRSVQFRIFAKDAGLITQQKICERLKALFVGDGLSGGQVEIEGGNSYANLEYVADGEIPGRVNEHYGWYLELIFQNAVKYSR